MIEYGCLCLLPQVQLAGGIRICVVIEMECTFGHRRIEEWSHHPFRAILCREEFRQRQDVRLNRPLNSYRDRRSERISKRCNDFGH